MNGFIDGIIAFIAGMSEFERIGANGISSSDAALVAPGLVLNALLKSIAGTTAPCSTNLVASFT